MHDVRGVQGRHATRHVPDDTSDVSSGDRLIGGDPLAQVRAIDEVHDDREGVSLRDQVMD